MADKNFKEQTIDSARVYDGRLLQVYRDSVRLPNGNVSGREWIKHPGAAVVIPYLGEGRILLVRQYRYPVRRVMFELPAGKIDPGESPADTVRRELAEETGFIPRKVMEVVLIHTCVGYSDERLFLYWADGLQQCAAQPDEDETIETVPIGIDSAMELLRRGEITDAKTLIGLFWAEDIIRRGRLGLCPDCR